MTDTVWARLPRDSAALFNPAFLAVILARAVQGATQEQQMGLEWAEAYLVVPMVLDSETRNSLPGRINSSIVSWVASNPEMRSVLPQKLSAMSPLVREGMKMALTSEVLVLNEGRLMLGSQSVPRRISKGTDEVMDIQKSAYFLGRWFGTYPSTPGLFALLGVRP